MPPFFYFLNSRSEAREPCHHQPFLVSSFLFYLALICEISGNIGFPLRPLASIAVHRFFSCKIEL
jgi:hypothetical protein